MTGMFFSKKQPWIVFVFLSLIFLSVSSVIAQDNSPSAVVPETPADSFSRRAELVVAPIYGFLIDDESKDTLGDPFGGMISIRYYLLTHFSVEAGLGYMIGYNKQDEKLDYLSYRRLNASSYTPFYGAANFELLPTGRVNPYIGLGAGGFYFALEQNPEDIESPVPIRNDELRVTKQQLLPMLIVKAGADVRITDWFGLGVEAAYRYIGDTSYQMEIPEVKQDYELSLTHLSVMLGIFVYY